MALLLFSAGRRAGPGGRRSRAGAGGGKGILGHSGLGGCSLHRSQKPLTLKKGSLCLRMSATVRWERA